LYKIPALLLVSFPLIAFLVVGATELVASRAAGDLARRLLAPFLGIAALALVWKPGMVGVATPAESISLGYILALVACIISFSGVFVTYSRRSSNVLMALGGLTLVFVSLSARIHY